MSYYKRIAATSVALLLITIGCIRFAPKGQDVLVVDQAPSGDNVALDAQIRITFSRPVDQQSAEHAFLIYPVVAGKFSWINNTVVVFVPREPFKPGTEYRVFMRHSLRDARGNTNTTETQWPFFTQRQIQRKGFRPLRFLLHDLYSNAR